MTEQLSQKTCKPCEGGVPPLTEDKIQLLSKQIPDWKVEGGGNETGSANGNKSDASVNNSANKNNNTPFIYREFKFKNYYHVMAFVNAIAWMAHHENHHPDLEIGYNRCLVRYTTHAIGGLSENDFICAAKVDALFSQGAAN